MTHPIAAPRAVRRWRGLGSSPVLVVTVAAVVGFLVIGQLRRPGSSPSQPLAAESEADLARILANLNAESDALQGEVADLKVQLSELRQSSQNQAAAAAAADDQLRTLQVLAGTVAVSGPGVTVVVEDPDSTVSYDAMIDIVQELRDAGAEAVAVDGHRVGATTSFGESKGRLMIDGAVIAAPYEVVAIGQPATLDGGLKIPGGAIDAIRALKGVLVSVARQAKVDLPALARPPTFKSARPVGSPP